MIVSSKIPTKLFPGIFCSFLGAFWKLFGLPGGLSNIINKKALRKSQKAYRKPPGNNFVVNLEESIIS